MLEQRDNKGKHGGEMALDGRMDVWIDLLLLEHVMPQAIHELPMRRVQTLRGCFEQEEAI